MNKTKFTVSQCKLRFLYRQKCQRKHTLKCSNCVLEIRERWRRRPRQLYSKGTQSVQDLQSEISDKT